ncbi:MAG: hypothetical protein SV775_00895 [Thermodesulfobacteriota bacterium]|nr:hypothetical protein [Thermodesulfobacteriota bacterium]
MTDRNAVRKSVKFIITCTLLCLSFFGTAFLYAETGSRPEDNEVLVIGTGTIVSGDLARAKQSAISQALVKGVESYLLRRLGGQDSVYNFQRLIQEIIPAAKDEIEKFHILTEEQIANKYKVLVRLRINEKVLDERLRQAGLVLTQGPAIRVLFLVSETKEGIDYSWWKDPDVHSALRPTELALHNVFQKRGLSPINRTLGLPEIEYSEDLRSSELRDADVLQWGTIFSADVVIYGRAETFNEGKVSLALKALDVRQGIQICQGFQVEQVEGGLEDEVRMVETLERLADLLAARLIPTIIDVVGSGHVGISRVGITLKGLSNYRQLKMFTDFLRGDVTGVESVRQTRVRKGSISIEVEFQGDSNSFLNRVLNHENLPYSMNYHRNEWGEIMLEIEDIKGHN